MKTVALVILSTLLFISCNEYTPKPTGYSRIERNEITWIPYDNPHFSFLYNDTAKIEELKEELKDDVWFNILYPEYDAVIYCTYLPIDKQKLPKALDDSYQLAYSHAAKADGISQTQFTDSLSHTSGIIYDIKGDVAVPVQFYITDSKSNFLRGSLYFNQLVKADSIAPVKDFLRDDIVKIMESLEWKKTSSKR